MDIRTRFQEHKLKITPQRIAVYEAVISHNTHPSAEMVAEYVREIHPNIATGTIYNILDCFVQKGLIHKISTSEDKMRYDGFTDMHHHLYDQRTDTIIDYYDDELNRILTEYFKNKEIDQFQINEIRLQIEGQLKQN